MFRGGLDALTMVALWGSSSAVLFRLRSLIRNAAGEVWESNDRRDDTPHPRPARTDRTGRR